MGIDILSYALGKAAGGGGGGGGNTLISSGWVRDYGSYAEIDGNTAELKTGSSSAHYVQLCPPANVERNRSFPKNSTFKIAITVNAVNPRANVTMTSASSGNAISSKNGLFQHHNNLDRWVYAVGSGSDVLTIVTTSGTNESVKLDASAADGSSSSSASATITITGMSYNGEIIFGSIPE